MSDDVVLRCEGPLGRSRDWVWLTVLAVVTGVAAVYFAVSRHTLFPLILLLVAALAPVAVLASTGKGAAVVGDELVFRNGRLAKRATIPLREIRELRWVPAANSKKILVLQVTHGAGAVDRVVSAISVRRGDFGEVVPEFSADRASSLIGELEAHTGLRATDSPTVEGSDLVPLQLGVFAVGLLLLLGPLPFGFQPLYPVNVLLVVVVANLDRSSARILGDQLVVSRFWSTKKRVVSLDDIIELRMVQLIRGLTPFWVLQVTATSEAKPFRVWAIRQRRPGYPYWSTTVNQPSSSVGPILRELLDRTGLTLEG